MGHVPLASANSRLFVFYKSPTPFLGVSAFPSFQPQQLSQASYRGKVFPQTLIIRKRSFTLSEGRFSGKFSEKKRFSIPTINSSSNSSSTADDPSDQTKKTPFGYTRKDVLLIGLGVTLLGLGLKSGLEFAGVDSLQAGNVVQLVLVLGLTVGWISTYIFRVSNKEMTYAQQLRDYEKKVIEKRLETLTEAELEALLEEVEEEKRR